MITTDFHSHHDRCGHAQGKMRDYIESARTQGGTHFGVSDHAPAYWLWGDHPQSWIQMAISEMPRYVAEARDLQTEYQDKIAVSVGIEADYIEGREDDLARLLNSQSFDYVLGSVHHCGADQNGGLVSIFHRARWESEQPEKTFTDFYRLVIKAAESGLFDILSHLTAVESYSPPLSDALMARLYPPVADAVAKSGCIVEINTSGYRKMGGDEPFPNRTMLRLLIERGVPLTFSSDCHKPAEVFYARDRVEALLTELGVKTDTGFDLHRVKRNPIPVYR
jgi:histidinol-phosphatase (PHP family)